MDVLAVGDPIWRDAYLLGGDERLAAVAVASLVEHGRLYDSDGHLAIRKGDHLSPEQTIQRLALNLVSLDPGATTTGIAWRLGRTEPVRAIQGELIEAGLLKKQVGLLRVTRAGKTYAVDILSANRDATGPRGLAYAPV